jgi:hypothetical protein
MTLLRSRIEKLEASARDVVRVQRLFWRGAVPDRIDIDGTTFDRLPGEPDVELINRISRERPDVEVTIFCWLSPEADRE